MFYAYTSGSVYQFTSNNRVTFPYEIQGREGVDKHREHMYVPPRADIRSGLILSGPVCANLRGVIPSAQKMPAERTGLENSVLQGPRRTDNARSAVTPHGEK